MVAFKHFMTTSKNINKTTLLIAAFAFLASCNTNDKSSTTSSVQDSSETSGAKESTLVSKSLCYIGVTGKDTVFATIDNTSGNITGKLYYKNSEKDNSKGDLKGSASGDTLKLTYEFNSEGQKSEREIYFLQQKNELIEGIGPQTEVNGKFKYADDKKISYQDGQKLNTADCEVVNKALK